jgi:hypothetical protein
VWKWQENTARRKPTIGSIGRAEFASPYSLRDGHLLEILFGVPCGFTFELKKWNPLKTQKPRLKKLLCF